MTSLDCSSTADIYFLGVAEGVDKEREGIAQPVPTIVRGARADGSGVPSTRLFGQGDGFLLFHYPLVVAPGSSTFLSHLLDSRVNGLLAGRCERKVDGPAGRSLSYTLDFG